MYLRMCSILLVPQLLMLLLVYQASIFIHLSNTVVNATSGVPEMMLECDKYVRALSIAVTTLQHKL